MLLLSDGEQTSGDSQPLAAAHAGPQARRARQHGRARHARRGRRGAAARTGSRSGSTVAPDIQTLREVARITGGRYAAAPTAARLKQVYRDLGSTARHEAQAREVTAAFAGVGVVLLLVASGALARLDRRPL